MSKDERKEIVTKTIPPEDQGHANNYYNKIFK